MTFGIVGANIPAMVMNIKLEDRVLDLERRVGEFEGSFQFISGQIKGLHKSLVEFQVEVRGRMDKQDGHLERQGTQLERHDREFAALRAEVKALPRAIAEIIGK